ncbi:MarR family winged helix-turn-helix transcriptional regulator [Pedobacter sp. Hv1]|uniref:MarR family winged helix-turn-helix transcriptional regulator n=1 Tax=Pedobacter sp. Hv1 TaxID=1740090 RepID=UPI0006D8B6FE|nr:MarR family transcriptional regulator [Pedobacter sp. Hv1]KQC01938.1 transcriptional regulator [Pedobacter sp. Hv1]
MRQLKKQTKVSKFENVYQQTVVNICFTYHWGNKKVKDALVPYDVTQQQYNVLRILKKQYPSPSTINLIRTQILDKMSDASRIVERLVQKGLVDKTENNYDKRAVDIMISEKGLALLKKLDKGIDLSKFIAKHITKEEATQLNVLLDKLRG